MKSRAGRRAGGAGVALLIAAASLSALLVVLAPPPAKAEVIDRIVAVINDSIITLSELNAASTLAMENPASLSGYDGGGEPEVRRKVLDKLIEQKLIKQAADRAGIAVSEKEIDNAVQEVRLQNGLTQEQLLLALAESGLTYKEYREQTEEQIRQVKFINQEFRSKISITGEDIEEYYRQNIEEFYGPPTVRIRMIFLSNRDESVRRMRLEEIESGMEAGQEFGELARQYSDGPASQSGGDLGLLRPGELAPDIEKIVRGLKPGEVSRPMEKDDGTYIIKLVERRPGEPTELSRLKGLIHERLFNKAMEDRFQSWLMDVKRYAHIEIRL